MLKNFKDTSKTSGYFESPCILYTFLRGQKMFLSIVCKLSYIDEQKLLLLLYCYIILIYLWLYEQFISRLVADLRATLLKSLVKLTKMEGEHGRPIKPIIYAFENISTEIRGCSGPKIPEMTAQVETRYACSLRVCVCARPAWVASCPPLQMRHD
jgi:hypothetical protein